ncbi:hypothetical protein M3G15_13640 [Paenibacillus sp. p3-SID1389]|uniref:hypothetical protein n=1 Tax=Paenibacillus sp. p3-SID1389 TaxID=2916364 RepID=UPI0021A523BE|nr:hypothetical protein [Paenibacillus sp. p3-SID1389]MCT2196180.1 hypothetical protein [Paenibacillus sp. p3-SID1389]
MKNQITLNQILEQCEISPKATVIIEQLEFFLKNDKDRLTFIDQYERRELWKDKKQSLKLIQLAKEIGEYHYTYNADQLESMDEKEALEHIFVEPVNPGKLYRLWEHKANIADLLLIKQRRPETSLMTALLYV